MSNCGYPEGVEHLHVARCYEGGRRDALAEVGVKLAAAEAAVDAPEMALSYEREGNRFCRICSDHDARGAK